MSLSLPTLEAELERLGQLLDAGEENTGVRLTAAVAQAQAQGREDLWARGLVLLGSWHYARSEWAAAHRHYGAALAVARRSGANRWVIRALNGLGLTAEERGQYREAAAHYRQGLDLARHQNDHAGLACILNNAALMWSRLGQPEQALDDLLQAQDLFLRVQHPVHTFMVAVNLIWALVNLGRHAQAYGVCKIYLDLAEDYGLKDRRLTLLCAQAVCQSELGQQAGAAVSAAEARQLLAELHGDERNPIDHVLLAMAYDRLGQPEQAAEVLNLGIELADARADLDMLATTHLALSRLYHQLGDDQAAYEHSWAYFGVREKLFPLAALTEPELTLDPASLLAPPEPDFQKETP